MEPRAKRRKINTGQGIPSHHLFTEEEVADVRECLLQWYGNVKRDLPWRRQVSQNSDLNVKGYAVWVSEMMLQQTQVATVVEYYNKWMKRWPTVEALADATVEEVNEMWAGLGYYSRGRRLREGAAKVMKDLKGVIPRTAQLLLKHLPGVGKYTAGAIASIAFNEATGVVDGNVIRVFSRLRCIGSDSTAQSTTDLFWQLANTLVDPDAPGDFNQSLMELGATVCSPKTPNCSSCPVAHRCKANERARDWSLKTENTLDKFSEKNRRNAPQSKETAVQDIEECQFCLSAEDPWNPSLGVENYPRKPKKRAPKEEEYVVCLYRKSGNSGDSFLLHQRAATGLLAGLWEFPMTLCVESDDRRHAVLAKNQARSLLNGSDDDILPLHLGEVTHIFSHLHHTYHVYLVKNASGEAKGRGDKEEQKPVKWVQKEELFGSAISTAVKKIFNLYEKHIATKNGSTKTKNKGVSKKAEKTPGQVKLDSFFKRKQ